MNRQSAVSNVYNQQLLRVFGVAGTVYPLAIIAVGFLVRAGIIDSRFYAGDALFIAISTGFLAGAILNTYFLVKRQGPPLWAHAVLVVVFHLCGALSLLFISGISSPFLFGWIVLIIAADIYFGALATVMSLATLYLTFVATILLYPWLGPEQTVAIAISVALITITAIVMSRLRALNDQERKELETTTDIANFQHERLLALVNSMGDAVITTDEKGTITVYNAATLSLLDTNADIEGKNIDSILQFTDPQGNTISVVEEASKRRRVFSRSDLTHTFERGEVMNVYLNASPVQPGYQADGERGFIFILRDITKDKSLEEERDEFISVVSHELRTPVAIAEGTLSNLMILQDRDSAKDIIQTAAKDAHDQILYLAKLVNDLSTLSRAERGVGDDVDVIDLNTTIEDMYKEYLPRATEKGLKLDLHLPGRLPHMKTSKLYLEEIIHNLMTNALKYTREGTITLTAAKKSGELQISVADTGIGMSKVDQRHIFQKFYRSEDYRTRETNGTGLGLYVCKKLADKLRVILSFESRLNFGSTFTLTIPANQLTDEPVKPRGPAGFVATKQ